MAWSQTSRTGDRADLAFEPSDRAWNMVERRATGVPRRLQLPVGRAAASPRRPATGPPAADIVVVNTHLYGAHLASGGVVLPEHDVVVFDEAHELEEVMTASLGVEVTPGRFRALVTAARALVEPSGRRRCSSRWRELGDQLGDAAGRAGRDAGARTTQAPAAAAEDRELADAAGAGRRAEPAASPTRCGGAARSVASSARRREAADPDRASRKTRARCRRPRHLAEDLHRLVTRADGEVAWVDGTRRNVRLRLSPIDVGPALAALLWGEVTSVLTSATIPPRIVERVGLEAFADRGAQRGEPVRLPRPRAALRGPPPARPAGRRGARRRCTRSWRS